MRATRKTRQRYAGVREPTKQPRDGKEEQFFGGQTPFFSAAAPMPQRAAESERKEEPAAPIQAKEQEQPEREHETDGELQKAPEPTPEAEDMEKEKAQR